MATAKNAIRRYSPELDFVYLTQNLVVCKAPSTPLEAERLSVYFQTQHPSSHLAVDCTLGSASASARGQEAGSGSPKFINKRNFDQVERYAGPLVLRQLMHFVHTADSFVSINPQGVIILLCDTGCDKSCVLGSAFLLHSGLVLSTQEGQKLVQSIRSPEARLAMRRPSLCRYLVYYETLLRSDSEIYHCNTLQLSRVRIVQGIPNLHSSLLLRGCALYCKVSHVTYMPTVDADGTYAEMDQPEGTERMVQKPLFDQLQTTFEGDAENVPFYNQDDTRTIDYDVSSEDIRVRGDVVLEICDARTQQAVLSVAFHTAFVNNEQPYLLFDKEVTDLACEDSRALRFPADMRLELFFAAMDDQPDISLSLEL